MILMPQIFDVTANENARYKCNELECCIQAEEIQSLRATCLAKEILEFAIVLM